MGGDFSEETYRECETRGWMKWLGANPVFPFTAKRMENDDDAYFIDIAKHKPFRLGQTM